MKVIVFSTKKYDIQYLDQANEEASHEITYIESRLSEETVRLAEGFDIACIFVNDVANKAVIKGLKDCGVGVIALRCAGFNNVDLDAAEEYGVCVVRVPAYSPYAVAEHAIALMMVLDRKIHRAHNRVREGNFTLQGLAGFDMHGKTAGIIGTGKIGQLTARILKCGFGCEVIAYDIHKNQELLDIGVEYKPLDELLNRSDIISLHCPLTPETYHIIDSDSISKMKQGAMLINTSRGGLIDAAAVIEGLKTGRIGYLGLDVYEEEEYLFFEDLSNEVIHDDVFARLMTLPNVIITSHQAYFTKEALSNIAQTTIENITHIENRGCCKNAVLCERVKGKSKKN
ncbi:MAG: 2-hydroxyacid dehydrogenase [Sedimentisphaeraceae bacterium JB056]